VSYFDKFRFLDLSVCSGGLVDVCSLRSAKGGRACGGPKKAGGVIFTLFSFGSGLLSVDTGAVGARELELENECIGELRVD